AVAVEVKRRGDIDGVEQLTRYLELLNRDPALSPVRGVFAAQEIRPQARVLAEDRGIRCVTLDYDAMRGAVDDSLRLFWCRPRDQGRTATPAVSRMPVPGWGASMAPWQAPASDARDLGDPARRPPPRSGGARRSRADSDCHIERD